MKSIGRFLKDTTLAGLLILLPVVVVIGVFTELAVWLREHAQSYLENLTGDKSEGVYFPMLIVVVILLGVSFLLGLMKHTQAGDRFGSWIERTLANLPGYAAVRALLGGLTEGEEDGTVKPVLLTLGEGARCFAYITENHGNGLLSVFIPDSPNPSSGSVQVVRADLIEPLNVHIADLSLALQQWGVGAAKVLAKHQAKGSPLPKTTDTGKTAI